MPTVRVPPRAHPPPRPLWPVTALVAAAAVSLTAQAPAPVAVTVAYDATGSCRVTAPGHAVHGQSRGPWRCDLAGLPAKAVVDLTVTVPEDATATDASFPRLLWVADGHGQRGSARLPAAPAFVRVVVAGGPGASQGRWLDVLSLAATALAVAWSLVYGRRA
jgi:hypothetical protein